MIFLKTIQMVKLQKLERKEKKKNPITRSLGKNNENYDVMQICGAQTC